MNVQSVLVTGSNRGIGLEMIRQLVDGRSKLGRPRHLFACCRNPSKAVELRRIIDGIAGTAEDAIDVHLVVLDVTSDKEIMEAVKYVETIVGENGLNVLINNAAILERGGGGSKLPRARRANVLNHLDVNAVSPLMVSQAFLPLLARASKAQSERPMSLFRSAVVNMSSGAGSIGLYSSPDVDSILGYRISKSALNMVTKCLSIDTKDDSILIVSITPGQIRNEDDPLNSARTSSSFTIAPTSLDTIVTELFETLAQFDQSHNGGFFRRDGSPVAF